MLSICYRSHIAFIFYLFIQKARKRALKDAALDFRKDVDFENVSNVAIADVGNEMIRFYWINVKSMFCRSLSFLLFRLHF